MYLGINIIHIPFFPFRGKDKVKTEVSQQDILKRATTYLCRSSTSCTYLGEALEISSS